MQTLSLQQTHDGFHQLKGAPLTINPVRWKAQLVAQDVESEVRPNRERIHQVANLLAGHDFTLPRWDFSLGAVPLYPQFQDREELLKHFLVLSSINFEYFHLGHQDKHGDALRFSEGKLSGAELATSRITEHWSQLRDTGFLSQLPYGYAAEVPFPQIPTILL